MKARLIVCADPAVLNAEAAGRLSRLARESVERRNRFTIALSGGSTPRGVYSALAEGDFVLPWESIHLFWGDERCVPPHHEQSNYRLADQAMVSRVPIPAENVHRMRGELPPDEGARDYRDLLVTFFSSPWPRFDVVLLGIGEDGHTASLFPGSAALQEAAVAVTVAYAEKLGSYRLTLTPPAINNADNVLFLASGESKAAVLKEVIEGEERPFQIPAQLIRPSNGRLVFMIDRAAARNLSPQFERRSAVTEVEVAVPGS